MAQPGADHRRGRPAPTVGRRVVVTGLAGSGKSTCSLALAAETGLPLLHLDLSFWKPGWVAPSETEWREKQHEVLAGDSWIADGNYPDTLDLRLERADTVVHLDLPWWRCSARALLRGFRMPGELPEGCDYTRWRRLRDEWGLAWRIGRHDRGEPEREREIISQHGQHTTLHVLRSRAEVTAFLTALRGVARSIRTGRRRRPGGLTSETSGGAVVRPAGPRRGQWQRLRAVGSAHDLARPAFR